MFICAIKYISSGIPMDMMLQKPLGSSQSFHQCGCKFSVKEKKIIIWLAYMILIKVWCFFCVKLSKLNRIISPPHSLFFFNFMIYFLTAAVLMKCLSYTRIKMYLETCQKLKLFSKCKN